MNLNNETFEGIETDLEPLVAVKPTSEVAREVELVAFNPETGEVTDEVHHERVSDADNTPALPGKPQALGKRAKRTEAQMIQALGGSSLKEASYVLDRVAKLEEKISELMGAISQKGRERVLEERPELSKY